MNTRQYETLVAAKCVISDMLKGQPIERDDIDRLREFLSTDYRAQS